MKPRLPAIILLIWSSTALAISANKQELDLFRFVYFGSPVVIVGLIFFYAVRSYLSGKMDSAKPVTYLIYCNYALIFSNLIFEVVFFSRISTFVSNTGQSWAYLFVILPIVVILLLALLAKQLSAIQHNVSRTDTNH